MGNYFSQKVGPGAVICALLLVAGFATGGADTPQIGLMFIAAFAAFCAVTLLFARQASGHSAISLKPMVEPGLAFAALLLGLSCLPVSQYLLKSHSLDGLYDPSGFGLEILKLLGLAIALLLGFRLSQTADNARKLFDAITVAGGVWAAASVVMFIMDPNGNYGVLKPTPGRMTAALCSANSAATLFGSLSILALSRLIGRYRASTARLFIERIDPVFALVSVADLIAMVLTLSRMGILATLIAILCLWFALADKKARLTGALIIAGIAAASSFCIFSGQLDKMMERFTQVHADGIIRQTIYEAHFHAAMQRPVFGYGLGSFISLNNASITPENYLALWPVRAAHNVYLQWFEETGLVGLGLLAVLNLTWLAPLVRAALAGHRLSSRIWGILLAYLVFLLHGLTDFAFQEIALTLYVSVLLGSGLAMAAMVKDAD